MYSHIQNVFLCYTVFYEGEQGRPALLIVHSSISKVCAVSDILLAVTNGTWNQGRCRRLSSAVKYMAGSIGFMDSGTTFLFGPQVKPSIMASLHSWK